jgi:hypothetical protein
MIPAYLPTVRSATLLALFLGVLYSSPLRAQMVDTTFWVPNGPVESIVLYDTTVIIGGSFDHVAPVTGSFVRLDTSTALPDASFFKVNGPVYAMHRDTSGYIYVGGAFSRCGNESVNNLFRLTPAGTFDYTFQHHVSGAVYAMYIHDSLLYIGGDFSQVDGDTRNNMAAVHLITGEVMPFNPNVNGPVYCMCPDSLYEYMIIGGDFNGVGVFSPPYLAKVKFVTGIPMSFNAVPWTATPNCNGPVYAVAVDSLEVYIGGEFTAFLPIQRRGLACLNLYYGSVMNEDANVQGAVYSITRIDRKIYFGGSFTAAGNQVRNNLACVDTGFNLQPWHPDVNGTVYAIAALDSERVFAGGNFSLANGDTCVRGALINYLDTGTVTSWNPMFNLAVRVACVDAAHRLYAGGQFSAMGGVKRNNLCAISVNSGMATAWNPDVNGTVKTMVLDNDSLYFTGDFTMVNAAARGRVAAIDLGTSAVLPFNPVVNGLVRTIAFTDSSIYMGGNFTQIGTESRLNIAKIDRFTMQVTPWNPQCYGTVNSILATPHWIYVAGFYSTIASVTRQNLARLHPVTGVADWNWICDTDDGIYHAEFYNNQLVLGGWFNTVNGQPSPDFAFVDTANAQVMLAPLNCDGHIYTFTNYGDDFFLVGTFNVVNAQYRPHLAAYDFGNANVDVWTPVPNVMPFAIAATAPRIFLGGNMTYTAGSYHPNFQVIDVQWVTDVNENAAQQPSFDVFPVPAAEMITVITGSHYTRYSITDLSGKWVASGNLNLNGGRAYISIAELAAGGYILSLYGEEGERASRRIIRY